MQIRSALLAWLGLVLAVFLGAGGAHADRRVALVIGNGGYRNAPHLPNPANDAEDVAAAVKRSGFAAILGVPGPAG